MRNVSLVRKVESNEGTLGHVIHGTFQCFSLELPWRNNLSNVSRVPCGIYQVRWSLAGQTYRYELVGVPDRTDVQIHSGNWTGDRALGLLSDVKGCILLGLGVGELNKQLAMLRSRVAVERFNEYMEREEFVLEILERFDSQA